MYTIKLNIGSWSSPALGGGYILSNCIKDGVTIEKKRDSDNRGIIRTVINGNILFYNIIGGDKEFNALDSLSKSGNAFVESQVYYNDELRASGIINLNTGTWDENRSQVLVPFEVKDEYTDILKNKNIKYNVCAKAGTSMYIRYISKVYRAVFTCYDGNPADLEENYYPNGQRNTTGIISPEWDFFTLISSTGCPDGGVTRIYLTTYVTFAYDGYTESSLFHGWWLKAGTQSEVVSSLQLPYFLRLYTIIEDLIMLTGDTVSISEDTYCTYFTEENIQLSQLYMADKSNVKRYSASNRALFEYTTLDDMLNYMKYMFNLDWTVIDNVFKLIRPSSYVLPDFTLYPKHDFTTILNGENITNDQKIYQYDPSNKFSKESWNMEESNDDDFFTADIDYRSLDKNTEEYDLLNFNNNVEYLIEDPEEASDSGFVMVASQDRDLYSKYIINTDVDGTDRVNYKLSALNLVKENHLIDKSYNKGYINDTQYNLTKRPDRKILFKNVPIYDINDLDFNYLVKCDVGNIIPESIKIDLTLKEFSTFEGIF